MPRTEHNFSKTQKNCGIVHQRRHFQKFIIFLADVTFNTIRIVTYLVISVASVNWMIFLASL